MFIDVSHELAAMALDFRMFKQAPVVFSKVKSWPRMFGISAGVVIKLVIFSAYDATVVFVVQCSVLISVSVAPTDISAFITKVNSRVLIEQPCLTEHFMGKGPATLPLICT